MPIPAIGFGDAVTPPATSPENALADVSSADVEYDQVPYPSYPERLTHPDNLAPLAGIPGRETPPVETCRALEPDVLRLFRLLLLTQGEFTPGTARCESFVH